MSPSERVVANLGAALSWLRLGELLLEDDELRDFDEPGILQVRCSS